MPDSEFRIKSGEVHSSDMLSQSDGEVDCVIMICAISASLESISSLLSASLFADMQESCLVTIERQMGGSREEKEEFEILIICVF